MPDAPRRHRPVVALVVLASLLVGLTGFAGPASAAAPVVMGAESDLGIQIPGAVGAVRSEQSAQGVLADGRYLTYFASSGGPGTAARFFAMDLSGNTVAELDIPTGTDVLSLVYSAASRSVYLAANQASSSTLYRWSGGALSTVASISGHLIQRLAAAPDGDIYIGTFAPSNGRLYVYDGALRDLGQPIAGESYVRSLAVDGSYVWLSNYREAAAKLIRVSRSTNARTTISTPASFAGEWSAFDMTLAGSYLFMRTVNSPRLYAYNTSTGKFATFNDQVGRVTGSPEVTNTVGYIDGISPYGISPLFEGRYVYFQRSGAGIMRVDLNSALKTVRVDKYNAGDNPISWPGATVAGPVSYAWLSGAGGRTGYSLVTTTIDGKVVINTPKQTAPLVRTLEAHDAPSTIMSLGTDSSRNIYSGGFDLPAGIGRYEPAQSRTTQLVGGQIEGFGQFGNQLVLGGYTGNSTSSGPLYLYGGTGNPVLKKYLGNSQERPVAIQQVGSKVAVGSVPIKNELGGALSIWDPATGALTVKRHLIRDHSVTSLATHNGLVVGGTSNVGGTGATPTATDGRLFTYNISTGALQTITPPRAESATLSWVGGITPDPTMPGHFWAISTGYVIQFKVTSTGAMSVTRNLGAFPDTSSPTGRELGIEFVGSTMFATVGKGISAINTTTGEQTVIASASSMGPVVGLVQGAPGDLYYARGARLYRYRVAGASSTTELAIPRVTSPDLAQPHAPGALTFAGTGTKNSTIVVSDGTRSRSTVVTDAGTWAVAAMDFPVGTYDIKVTSTMTGLTSKASTATLRVADGPGGSCVVKAPVPTNVNVNGYNTPNKDYAFEGTGTPGTLVTMVSGSRSRSATVRPDGTWSMNPVWFGWWAGTVPFTASLDGCPSVTNEAELTFATKPTSHVKPLLISHDSSTYYEGGEINFKGKGTPGAVITMIVGGQTRFAAVSPTGRWHMRTITVGPAPFSLRLASSVPGYANQVSRYDVYFGTAPRSIVTPILTSHTSGVRAPAGKVVFAGKGTPGSKISVAYAGQSRATFVRANGRWDLTALTVAPGTRKLTFKAYAPGVTSRYKTVTIPFY